MQLRLLVSVATLITVCCAMSLPARADELTPAKKADIEKLLTVTGAMAIGKQLATPMLMMLSQSIKKANPEVPQNVINNINTEVMAVFDENLPAFRDEIVLVYAKHYSAAEIKELLKFYNTEIGQKTIKLTPVLMQEGMMVGQRWGQSLGPKIQQRVGEKMKQQGIKL